MIENQGLSVACNCRRAGLSRAAFNREPVNWLKPDHALIEALNGLTDKFPRLGFWKYVDPLSAREYPWNHKRIYRVYCQLGLNQPRRTKRRLPERDPIITSMIVPEQPNQVWSAKFMSDALYR